MDAHLIWIIKGRKLLQRWANFSRGRQNLSNTNKFLQKLNRTDKQVYGLL